MFLDIFDWFEAGSFAFKAYRLTFFVNHSRAEVFFIGKIILRAKLFNKSLMNQLDTIPRRISDAETTPKHFLFSSRINTRGSLYLTITSRMDERVSFGVHTGRS